MSTLTAKQLEDAVDAAYRAALNDPNSGISPPPPPPPDPITPTPGGGGDNAKKFDITVFNQKIVMVVKKLAGFLVGMIPQDVIKEKHTDQAIDFFLSMKDMPMPKSQEKVVLQKLDDILSGIQDIKYSQTALQKALNRQLKLEYAFKASVQVQAKWKEIHGAIQAHDASALFEAIRRINDDSPKLSENLAAMDKALTDPTFSDEQLALAPALHDHLSGKLLVETRELEYGVIEYWEDVKRWRSAFVGVERMGVALLILFQQCRPQLGQDSTLTQTNIVTESLARVEAWTKMLLGDVVFSPSFRALHQLAHVKTAAVFPPTWQLKINGTDQLLVVEERWNPSEGGQRGMLTPFNSSHVEVREAGAAKGTICKLFTLTRRSDGYWRIQGTREDVKSYDGCKGFARWAPLVYGSKGYGKYKLTLYEPDWQKCPEATFKVIPKNGSWAGGLPEVKDLYAEACRLLVLPLDATALSDIRVRLTPINAKPDPEPWVELQLAATPLTYPVSEPDDVPGRIDRAVAAHGRVEDSVCLRIVNKINVRHILVLEDSATTGRMVYDNVFWLDGQTHTVGGYERNGIKLVVKLAIYKLKDNVPAPPSDADAHRLVTLMPETGRPGIRTSHAELVSYLFVHPVVDNFPRRNWLGAIDMNLDDPSAKLESIYGPRGLYDGLGQCYVVSGDSKLQEWAPRRFNAQISIDKGNNVSASITVYKA